jgi:hypothetical protein
MAETWALRPATRTFSSSRVRRSNRRQAIRSAQPRTISASRSGICEPGIYVDDAMREYHPRPEGEWQGMRERIDQQAICDGEASCGLALACIDGLCGPCLADSDCAAGEACALDHCVLETNLGCRSYTDCEEGSLCLLSGYSSGYRGNHDMRAYCLSPNGGTPQRPEDLNR